MDPIFTSDFFIGNRQRLRTLFKGTAPIVVTANGMLQRNGPAAFPFRQDSNFWYLTGLDIPDVVLVMDKAKEYLILPHRERMNEVFNGELSAEVIMQTSGIGAVYNHKDGWDIFKKRVKSVRNIATLEAPSPYQEHYEFHSNPTRDILTKSLLELNPTIKLLDLRMHLMRMRLIKQSPELLAIKKAIGITVTTLEEVQTQFGTFTTEADIEAAIEYGFKKRGATGHGYEPIVAAGKNACTIHHRLSPNKIPPRELLLIDIGAEYNNYASDISRTYALQTPTKRQQAVFAAVNEAFAFGLNQLKPGISIKECELNIEQFIGEKLRELGLITTIERESVRQYYPHMASHFMGLDVHDTGDYAASLEAGNVITLEPGIYIPEEGIGVRIEDDLLVTKTGVKVLSAALPHALA